MAEQLCGLLATPAARQAFQRAVETGHCGSLSVFELRAAFRGDADLVQQVRDLVLEGARSSMAPPGHERPPKAGGAWSAAGAAAGTAARWSASSTAPTTAAAYGGCGAGPARPGRCSLPFVEPGYVGRNAEAADIAQHLLTKGSLVLLARGGMGKSSLAADVGWRLYRSGHLPGGALWVDLREARSGEDVEARFCAALGMQRVRPGALLDGAFFGACGEQTRVYTYVCGVPHAWHMYSLRATHVSGGKRAPSHRVRLPRRPIRSCPRVR